jgi:hypothetical protein
MHRDGDRDVDARYDGRVRDGWNGWSRGLLVGLSAVDRVARGAHRAWEAARDAIAFALVSPADRDAATAWLYARQPSYARGGRIYDEGLRPGEESLLAQADLRVGERILLGGAGGGREARALVDRGYRVVAFDPCTALFDSLRASLAGHLGSSAHVATYDDLPDAIEGRGPLARAVAEGPFDAVILGWGSLSHVLDADRRSALFSALATLCPSGPWIATFVPVAPQGRRAGRAERLAMRLRALTEPDAEADEPIDFRPEVGFFARLSPARLTAAIAVHDRVVLDPHALSEGQLVAVRPARDLP